MATFYPVQLQTFTLYGAGASVSDTSITLTSFLSIDGVQLTMAAFGSKGYITLEPNSGTKEEQISFSGITANLNGTTTLTGIKTVLFATPFTETSGLAKPHAGNTKLVVSNTSAFYGSFAVLDNNQTWNGTNTFTQLTTFNVLPQSAATPTAPADLVTKTYADTTFFNKVAGTPQTVAGVVTFSSLPTIPLTPSVSTDAASKGYVDGVAVAGAPNASTTVKGIVQEATLAQVQAGTSTGSTGARLFISPSSLPAIPQIDLGGYPGGSVILDGALTYSGMTLGGSTYTLTADLFASSLTVNNSIILKTAGYIVHCVSMITNNGTIDNSGGNGGNGGNSTGLGGAGGTAGTAGAGGAGATLAAAPSGTAGGAGSANSGSGNSSGIGTSKNPSLGVSGSLGGTGGSALGVFTGGGAGAAGTATVENAVVTYTYVTKNITANLETTSAQFTTKIIGATSGYTTSTSAGSSGGGGGAGENTGGGYGGGGGGGGGGTGGNILLISPTIVNAGIVSANGGNGGNGGNAGSGSAGLGAGGAGGAGGVIMMIYNSYSGAGTITVTPGATGSKGTGNATGSTNATVGLTGNIYRAKLINYSN